MAKRVFWRRLLLSSMLFVISVCIPGTQAQTFNVFTVVGPNDVRYVVGTGTNTGGCSLTPTGAHCADGFNQVSFFTASGCGPQSGTAFCIILPPGQYTIPASMNPMARSTLECPDRGIAYEVTTGTKLGDCTKNNGVSLECHDNSSAPGHASASCAEGCGATSGAGECTIKPLPTKPTPPPPPKNAE